jgi:hypothetical protein
VTALAAGILLSDNNTISRTILSDFERIMGFTVNAAIEREIRIILDNVEGILVLAS